MAFYIKGKAGKPNQKCSKVDPEKHTSFLSISPHQMDWTRGHAIGHGSTATVSLATSLVSGEVFAVKSAELFQSEFLQREQKILSSISSPYIVSYMGHEITREGNKVMYNLFLEYMPGGTLIDEIRARGGRLGEALMKFYTCQILQGLRYLHSNGLVHCDMKGRNVLIGQASAKIADFGCAKPVSPVGVDAATTRTPISGTPMFMAPEVARGEEQSFASDIWGLGCTIIEMATGGGPWPNANDPFSVLYRVGYSGLLPEFPCCLSDQGRDFLDKCLRRDPKERWTASKLLNHPFLGEFNSNAKQVQEANPSSNSPTSILDPCFWSSLDESESLENHVHSGAESSAEERIRRLFMHTGGPSWDWDQNWVTIRENCCEESDTIMDEIEARNDMIRINNDVAEQECHVGSEDLSSLDCNFSNRISGDFWGACKYGNVSLVNSSLKVESDKDMLLITSTSIRFLHA